MSFFKKFFVAIGVVSICGCALATGDVKQKPDRLIKKDLPSSYALKGTNTAVVGIALDKKGFPVETVKEIILTPGQKVIFAGPDKFEIVFKKDKSPNKSIQYESRDGVIRIDIPKDILEKREFAEEFKKNNYILFDYAIRVNGLELDPPMIIRRDN